MPPIGGSAPSQKKKMAKISHFRQLFRFLPPKNRILLPRCPPQKILVPPLLIIGPTLMFFFGGGRKEAQEIGRWKEEFKLKM